jgi:hypothetical protein
MGRTLEVSMKAMLNGKADAWRKRIDDQWASGQSVRAWCKANDTRECSFYWWRARLGLSRGKRRLRGSLRSAEAKPTPLAFAQVVVHPAAELLRLRFAGQRELILPASMPLAQVAKLVYAIENAT